MSEKTRVKRPTYATPRKNPPGKMIHQSTNIVTMMTPNGPVSVKGRGSTYYRSNKK